MTDIFVGDNDHGDTPLPPLSDLLWAEVTKLRQEIVQLNNTSDFVVNEANQFLTRASKDVVATALVGAGADGVIPRTAATCLIALTSCIAALASSSVGSSTIW